MSINNNRTHHRFHRRNHQCPCAHHDSPAIHDALDCITHYHKTHCPGTDINKWVFTEDSEPDSIPVAVVYITGDIQIIQAIDSALKNLNRTLTKRTSTDGVQ